MSGSTCVYTLHQLREIGRNPISTLKPPDLNSVIDKENIESTLLLQNYKIRRGDEDTPLVSTHKRERRHRHETDDERRQKREERRARRKKEEREREEDASPMRDYKREDRKYKTRSESSEWNDGYRSPKKKNTSSTQPYYESTYYKKWYEPGSPESKPKKRYRDKYSESYSAYSKFDYRIEDKERLWADISEEDDGAEEVTSGMIGMGDIRKAERILRKEKEAYKKDYSKYPSKDKEWYETTKYDNTQTFGQESCRKYSQEQKEVKGSVGLNTWFQDKGQSDEKQAAPFHFEKAPQQPEKKEEVWKDKKEIPPTARSETSETRFAAMSHQINQLQQLQQNYLNATSQATNWFQLQNTAPTTNPESFQSVQHQQMLQNISSAALQHSTQAQQVALFQAYQQAQVQAAQQVAAIMQAQQLFQNVHSQQSQQQFHQAQRALQMQKLLQARYAQVQQLQQQVNTMNNEFEYQNFPVPQRKNWTEQQIPVSTQFEFKKETPMKQLSESSANAPVFKPGSLFYAGQQTSTQPNSGYSFSEKPPAWTGGETSTKPSQTPF